MLLMAVTCGNGMGTPCEGVLSKPGYRWPGVCPARAMRDFSSDIINGRNSVNTLLLAAAALAFATGLVHTVMGEVLIFRHLRRGTVVPTFGGDVLRERHVRILWASWHVLTLLGWCMAAMLVELAGWPASDITRSVAHLISLGMFTGAMTVGIGTRGQHPGWLAMLLVALLVEAAH